ncbi:MAG: hypothetical protein ACOVQA_14260 [Thermoflexibacteraceae bacterium]|jgi:hypothetical protein
MYKNEKKVGYKDFEHFANNPALTKYEKIGFPNSYREGKDAAIFQDILAKIPLLHKKKIKIVDIGIGCSDLAAFLVAWCKENEQELFAVDSAAMLQHLPDENFIHKIAGYYPDTFTALESEVGKIDVIICYSVFHYVFSEGNVYDFLDKTVSLMKDGGSYFLLGDIPNESKRKRFFSTSTGVHYHQEFMQTTTLPEVNNFPELGKIDDGILLGIMQRYRNLGYEAFVLPQNPMLPLYNRREDILIQKW